MANSYLEFSEVLPHLTDEEQSWLQHQLEPVYVLDDREYTAEELPEDWDAAAAEWRGCRAFRDLKDDDGDFDDDDAGFACAFCENADWGRHLWFYAEEWGCLKRLAHLVRKFLAAFRPRQFWSLTYAATCSKPRAGAFGGGAVFITATDVTWCDSHDFVQQHAVAARKRGLRETRLLFREDLPESR